MNIPPLFIVRLFGLFLFYAFLLTGCGLTKAQLTATQSFAKAAKSYPSAPAGIVTAYANVYVAREAFDISTVRGAPGVWQMSGQAADTFASAQSDAKQLSDSLQILTQYGDLLTKLSSSDFSVADEKAAGSLSGSIDKGITQYNKSFGKKVPSVGKYVAVGVEALGELYIRKRQAEALKWYVSQAEPVIEELTADINSNLSDFQTSIIPGEECQLANALCTRQRLVADIDRQQAEQIAIAVQMKGQVSVPPGQRKDDSRNGCHNPPVTRERVEFVNPWWDSVECSR
ncbi:MAG: hypothetical protein ACLQU2_30580, partial [Candidatus Binataceae bacterium]